MKHKPILTNEIKDLKPCGFDMGNGNTNFAIMNGDSATANVTNSLIGIPSVAYIADGKIYVFEEAINRANEDGNMDNLLRYAKTDMRMGEVTYKNGITPEKLMEAMIQSAVKKFINNAQEMNYIGEQSGFEAVGHITATVPAGLGKEDTSSAYNDFVKECFVSATGLPEENVHILEEPTAAALAYLKENNIHASQRVMVFDLGAGTIDISIVEFNDMHDKYNVLAVNGDMNIGGRAFDERLLELVLKKAELKDDLDPAARARLVENIICAKHMLSEKEFATVGVESESGIVAITITREEFETATKDILANIESVVDAIMADSDFGIDKVVLVGGASNMVQIKNMLKVKFSQLGESNIVLFKPSSAVALGAAYYSQICAEKSVSAEQSSAFETIANHTYGIACYSIDEEKDYISNILIKGTSADENNIIEVKSESTYSPVQNGQTELNIVVYESDSIHEISTIGKSRFNGAKAIIQVPQIFTKEKRACDFRVYVTLILRDSIISIKVEDENGKVISHKQIVHSVN